MINVGIVGSGWIAANRHIPSFRKDHRVTIRAIIDHQAEKAREVSRKFGIPEYFTSIEEIPDEKLDVLSICTPPQSHARLAIAALEKGWHALVEKPIAMSVEEADLMISAAQTRKLKLGVCHNFLFSRSMNKAMKLAREPSCGPVLAVQATQLSSRRRRLPRWYSELPGGLFYDEAPHMIYLMQHFAGHFKEARASARPSLLAGNTPGRIQAALDADGATASVDMIFDSPVSSWILTVVFERKVLYIDLFRDIAIWKDAERNHTPVEVLRSSLDSIIQDLVGTFSSGVTLSRGRLLFGHDVLISRFIDSIIRDDSPPVSAEQGREVVRTMWEILRSSGLSTE